jgi:hypothetical protein
MNGSDESLSAQLGCIMFHPSCYGGRPKLTPTIKNKWSGGWASSWFYCQVLLRQSEARGKGIYLLHSEMSDLDYVTEALHSCAADDINAMAFQGATKIIGGYNAVEEFVACGILHLSDNLSLDVERAEALLSEVIVPLP